MARGLHKSRGELAQILAANPHLSIANPEELGGVPKLDAPSSPVCRPGRGLDAPKVQEKPLEPEKKKSRGEVEFELILKAKFPNARVLYERITFKLASRVRYTPDFDVIFPDGRVEFYEVKGKFLFKGAHEDHTRLSKGKARSAADAYPFRFHIAMKLSGSWEITPLRGLFDELSVTP